MKTINTRRSIRKYTDAAVSDTLLRRLLSEAERTQTMGNLQLYSVVVTRSDEQKRRLAPAHFNQPMVDGAPVVLTFCADFRRTTLWAENRNADPGYDNMLSFQNAATDALLFCQTFCNLAEEEGLGCCFLGTTVYMPQMIIDVLQLPRLVVQWLLSRSAGPTSSLRSPTVCPSMPSCTRRLTATIPPSASTASMPRRRHWRRTESLCA